MNKVRIYIGNSIKIFSWVLGIIIGLWAFYIDLQLVYYSFGRWGLLIALFVSPLTFALIPFYALIVHKIWFPLVLEYGGGLLVVGLLFLGSRISGDYY